ncbi:MAG: L-serine ammonia-lyase, iron-sulfur-dependent, subunit alpha [Eubacteriales bacterium]
MGNASIFNDVLGPIMRGPSSSHVAAAARIGAVARDMSHNSLKKVEVRVDVSGTLVLTYDSQGSNLGMHCGLLGIDLAEEIVPDCFQIMKDKGIEVTFAVEDMGETHPNYYRLDVECMNGHRFWLDAISTGGGMIEVLSYNGTKISMIGDYYELLAQGSREELEAIKEEIHTESIQVEEILIHENIGWGLLQVKSRTDFTRMSKIQALQELGVNEWVVVTPVLPTLSNKKSVLPFSNAEELLQYSKKTDLSMGELGVLYECIRSGNDRKVVMEKMDTIYTIMEQAVKTGLEGTEYKDRILHAQSPLVAKNKKRMLQDSLMSGIIESITAIMEVKSSMGVIVAAPTAGSCGCLPGTVIGVSNYMEVEREESLLALFAAGLIGVFFTNNATFAAEVAGCQVECGAGSGMAAAAVAQLLGGTVEECVDAASMALQSISGLVCDPVASRVEVPCLGKNIMGGMNAVASANVMLAGYDKVIPLDETIAALMDIGQQLPIALRCTCGGLGMTPTSEQLLEELAKN